MNARSENGETALIWASSKGYLDIVEFLLRNNADICGKISANSTPLMAGKFKLLSFFIKTTFLLV